MRISFAEALGFSSDSDGLSSFVTRYIPGVNWTAMKRNSKNVVHEPVSQADDEPVSKSHGKLLVLRIRSTQWERAVNQGLYFSIQYYWSGSSSSRYDQSIKFSESDAAKQIFPESSRHHVAHVDCTDGSTHVKSEGISAGVLPPAEDFVDSSNLRETEQRDYTVKKEQTEPKYDLGCLWWLMPILSSILYLLDIGTDAYVAYTYYSHSTTFFSLAITFILLCALVNTIFGIVLYVDDYKRQRAEGIAASRLILALNVTLCILQVDTVMRYCRALMYSLRVRRSRSTNEKYQYYVLSLYEDNDTSMLRLVEANLEAAPQLLIQLYFFITHNVLATFPDYTSIIQVVSIFFSFTSYAFSYVMYARSLRLARRDKRKLTWSGAAFMFIWQLCMIVSRMLALAIFAAACTWLLGVMCAVHFVIMLVWILLQRTEYCERNSAKEFAFDFVCALIHVFSFLNLKEGRSRGRYTFFYALFFVEAVVMCSLARFAGSLTWLSDAFVTVKFVDLYLVPLYAVVFASLLVGLCFQMVYYAALHPTGGVPLCVPCSEWKVFSADYTSRADVDADAQNCSVIPAAAPAEGAGAQSHNVLNGTQASVSRVEYLRSAGSPQVCARVSSVESIHQIELRRDSLTFKQETRVISATWSQSAVRTDEATVSASA